MRERDSGDRFSRIAACPLSPQNQPSRDDGCGNSSQELTEKDLAIRQDNCWTDRMTEIQISAAVREGARRALYFSHLSKPEFDEWTIENLLRELARSLEDVVPNERDRIIHLNVAILKQCVQKGGIKVTVPKTSWYDENKEEKTSAITRFIKDKGFQLI
jgi:hypothetical protein